jgi:outer membrane biosynthesis protein TonB
MNAISRSARALALLATAAACSPPALPDNTAMPDANDQSMMGNAMMDNGMMDNGMMDNSMMSDPRANSAAPAPTATSAPPKATPKPAPKPKAAPKPKPAPAADPHAGHDMGNRSDDAIRNVSD